MSLILFYMIWQIGKFILFKYHPPHIPRNEKKYNIYTHEVMDGSKDLSSSTISVHYIDISQRNTTFMPPLT